MSDSTDRILVKLTGAAPVSVRKSEWPRIAHGGVHGHDGEVRCQANETWSATLRVRQHADGRTVVYGQYEFTSNYQGARDFAVYAGRVLDPGADLGVAIGEIAEELCEQVGDRPERVSWIDQIREAERDCVADLPPIEL